MPYPSIDFEALENAYKVSGDLEAWQKSQQLIFYSEMRKYYGPEETKEKFPELWAKAQPKLEEANQYIEKFFSHPLAKSFFGE